jgi:hypothetical protein
MGVDLESFEKRATAFGRFNACPDCLGAHTYTQWWVGDDGLDGTGTGGAVGDGGRGSGSKAGP